MLRMQEIAFPDFKFQTFPGEYAPTHVAFGHCYPPLASKDKLWLIYFYFLCVFSFFYFKHKYSLELIWMLRMQEMAFSGFKFQIYVGHTHCLQPFPIPL